MKKILKNDAFWFLSLSVVNMLVVYGLNTVKGAIVAKTVYATLGGRKQLNLSRRNNS